MGIKVLAKEPIKSLIGRQPQALCYRLGGLWPNGIVVREPQRPPSQFSESFDEANCKRMILGLGHDIRYGWNVLGLAQNILDAITEGRANLLNPSQPPGDRCCECKAAPLSLVAGEHPCAVGSRSVRNRVPPAKVVKRAQR